MTMRLIVLFSHIVGMLVFFVALARGGYFEFWWVRGPLILLVVMGVIGGATRRGSISARRTSWFVRLTLALVAVYLMVFKP